MIPLFIGFVFITDELIAWISYECKVVPVLIAIELTLMFYTFFPVLAIQYHIYIILGNIGMFFIMIVQNSYDMYKRNDEINRSKRLIKKKCSVFRLLLLKECIFLFEYKKSIILSALIFSIIFMFTDRDVSSPDFYISFFVFELAINYGFNYLNIEKDSLIPILMISEQFNTLIRIKSFCFIWGAFFGSLVIALLYLVIGKLPVNIFLSTLGNTILIVGIFNLLSNFCSINIFSVELRQTIFKVALGLIVFLIISVVSQIQTNAPHLSKIYYISVSVMCLSGMYFFCVNVNYFSSSLQKRTDTIVQYLLKDI